MDKAVSPYIVDKSDEIEAIKRRHGPRYYCEPEAIAQAAALWGAQSNDCGVVLGLRDTVQIEQGRYRSEVRLYATAKRFWFIGLSLTTSMSGFGSPPSVWEPCAFTDNLHARRWALDYLIHRLTFSGKRPSADPQKAMFITKLEVAKTPQMELF